MADVDLTITIPDAWTAKVVDAFTRCSGTDTRIRLEIEKHSPDLEQQLRAEWTFNIPEKGDTETMVEFGQRFLRAFGIAVIKAVDKKDDEDRYRAEIAVIVPPASDVPDDVLT